MTDSDKADRQLEALLAYRDEPKPDAAFADHVIALAAADLKLRQSRRRLFRQVGAEAAGLGAVLIAFAFLSRIGPSAGFGDALPVQSPAMVGLVMLALWALLLPSMSARRDRILPTA